MPRRLEIGPGEHRHEGFETLVTPDSGTDRNTITHLARWGEESLPLGDRLYDLVYASHVLEHVPWTQTGRALDEVLRILRPGGRAEIWVPDFAYIVRAYLRRECGDKWRRYNPSGDPMTWVNGRLYTYGPGADNWHHACFDYEHLRDCLTRSGFTRVRRLDRQTERLFPAESHGPMELGVEGFRP